MAVLRFFLEAIAAVLDAALWLYMLLIIARAVVSWVNPDPYNPIVQFLYKVTEPVLRYLRRRLPLVFDGVDLTPLVVLAIIMFLRYFLVRTLMHYASTF
jgi:YggT family protein